MSKKRANILDMISSKKEDKKKVTLNINSEWVDTVEKAAKLKNVKSTEVWDILLNELNPLITKLSKELNEANNPDKLTGKNASK